MSLKEKRVGEEASGVAWVYFTDESMGELIYDSRHVSYSKGGSLRGVAGHADAMFHMQAAPRS